MGFDLGFLCDLDVRLHIQHPPLNKKGSFAHHDARLPRRVGIKASLPFCTVVLHKIRQQKGQLTSKR